MPRSSVARRASPFASCACLLLLCLGCISEPVQPEPERPTGEMSTEIGQPLATVNAAVLKAAPSCGLTIDTRRFVEGLVVLEGTLADGERVRLRLESHQPTSTVLTVSALGNVSDPQLVQLLHAIRGKVWK